MKLRNIINLPLNPLFALALAVFAGPLQAGMLEAPGHYRLPYQQVERQQAERLRVQRDGGISRDEAAAIVKRRYGGKILAISETQKDGRPAYRVKGLSDQSQVYVVFVDKKSGRISS